MSIVTLIIDNYDSFTYNLYHLIGLVNGVEPVVIKNDELTLHEIEQINYDNIIISPGPGHPNNIKDLGVCGKIIAHTSRPLLGVCLGHQAICQQYGGRVDLAPQPRHGWISTISHEQDSLFDGIPETFKVVRYHSLSVCQPLPKALKAIAYTGNRQIMALKHRIKPIFGVQFHPESICSQYGDQIFKNFKKITEAHTNLKKRSYFLSSPIKKQPYVDENKKTYFYLLTKKIEYPASPESIFNHYFSHKKYSIWLDSSKSCEKNSLSIMGCVEGPHSFFIKYDVSKKEIIIKHKKLQKIKQNIWQFLKDYLNSLKIFKENYQFNFCGGFVGYLGYEVKNTFSENYIYHSQHPDVQMIFLDRFLIFDHHNRCIHLVGLHKKEEKKECQQWINKMHNMMINMPSSVTKPQYTNKKIDLSYTLKHNKSKYLNNINRCLQYIKEGQSYEICLTNKIFLQKKYLNPWSYYKTLRHINPSSYGSYLRFDDLTIASSSIELFLTVDSLKQVVTKPIKGTLPRGKNRQEDSHLKNRLKKEIKFISENLMIVDLLRHDLGKVCKLGSVTVPRLMDVETYPTVHQLVSTVCGQLKKDKDSIDCLKACFPPGSMTGAPKIRTLDLLDLLEVGPRGVYSGVIGYLSADKSAQFSVTIRTAVIDQEKIEIGVGGAITALSCPQEEFEEMLLKAKSLLTAYQMTINEQ